MLVTATVATSVVPHGVVTGSVSNPMAASLTPLPLPTHAPPVEENGAEDGDALAEDETIAAGEEDPPPEDPDDDDDRAAEEETAWPDEAWEEDSAGAPASDVDESFSMGTAHATEKIIMPPAVQRFMPCLRQRAAVTSLRGFPAAGIASRDDGQVTDAAVALREEPAHTLKWGSTRETRT